VISPDFCFPFQALFTPTGTGSQSATLSVTSNDLARPTVQVEATGTGTVGDIRVTGSTDFGDVCPEDLAEKIVSVCNVGGCNLNVASASIDCPDFTLINNPFQATVSPDSCLDLVIRFTPTSAGPKTCNLTITSDDPDSLTVTLVLTANTPSASIDVPPDEGFPPTVIQSVGACDSRAKFPVSNTGSCNLVITDLSITDNAEEFSLAGLPSFPIILEPGHIVGEGDLQIVFAPEVLDRARLGELSVTYVSDPITGATTTETRALCGEGVRTGARVLVTLNGTPVSLVRHLHLQRVNANSNRPQLDTVETVRNLVLETVTPKSPCASFQYHREYGTVSNPIQLLPGSYKLTARIRVDGHQRSKTVGFDVQSCDFNPTLEVDFE